MVAAAVPDPALTVHAAPRRSARDARCLQQTRHHRLCGLDHGGARHRSRIAARSRRDGIFHGVGGELNELLGSFELAVFLADRFVFLIERAGPERGKSAGDRWAETATDPRTDGIADDRYRLQR